MPEQEKLGVEKGPDAFRTISEVADDLDLPQHVLRFWETRFSQIKPLKRGGGRRYYRRDDVELLRGIRHLLYGEGYTIRGVQRILREQGLRYVQTIWQEGGGEGGAPLPRFATDNDFDDELDDVGSDGTADDDMPVDAGHPGAPARGRKDASEPEARGTPLSGLLGLLPSRRSGRDEPPPLPEIVEMPPPVEPYAPEGDDYGRAEPIPAFPFRPVPSQAPMEARHAERDIDRGLPERAEPLMPPPQSWASPRIKPAPAQAELELPLLGPTAPPARASAVEAPPPATAGRSRLSRDDVRHLQATLYELQECQRILDEAEKSGR